MRPVLLLALLLTATLALAPPAPAASCAQQIIDDWADDASPGVDGTYAIPCYREAIRALPEDLRSYSSAADDIELALQERLREQQGGAAGGSTDATGGGASGSGSGDGGTGGAADPSESDAGSTSKSAENRDPAASTSPEASAGGEGDASLDASGADAPAAELFQRQLGDGGSSLPAPVIALLALAGLAALLAAGWLIARQRRRSAGG